MDYGIHAALYTLRSRKFDVDATSMSSFSDLIDIKAPQCKIELYNPTNKVSWWIDCRGECCRISTDLETMREFIQGYISVMEDAEVDFRDYSYGLPHTLHGNRIREFLIVGYDIPSIWHTKHAGKPARIFPYSPGYQDPRTQI